MTDPSVALARTLPGIGKLALKPFRVAEHAVPAHAWLASDHAAFWGMQALSSAEVADYFQQIENADTHNALIGLHDGAPAFLIETYAPEAEPVGGVYTVEAGDRGMHILIAPPTRAIALFTWAVFALAMDSLFADARVERVVVEPDVANEGIHVLNRRAGFIYERQINLPGKTGWLATCTRADHAWAMSRLTPSLAQAAGRLLQPESFRL